MEDFQSKYTGEQVEEFLDQIANGEIGGGIEAETDPIFSASPAASITDAKKAEWDNKVDKVSGKQLSTEDFTSALKAKLEELSNYDDTELSNALSTLRGDFDKLVSGDTTTAIKTFNEIVAFLEGIEDSQDLEGIIASIEQQIAGKQDTIKDLATIREGASKGATAVQPSDIPKETYLADFTMFSLRQGMNNGGQVNCDMNSLIEAMATNKTILVREDEESDGYKGVCVLNGYAEDLLYFSIVDHAGDILYCEGTNYTNTYSYIDGRTLYVRRWDDKQDALVSGENIKTINGESIVGRGNITIQGGSGGGSAAYPIVNHGTNDTTFTLTPNTFHVWGEVSSLDLSFGAEQAGVANEYLFQFTSGSSGTTLALPDDIKWANDWRVDSLYTYQVSILNGIASSIKVLNPLSGTDPA